MSRHAPDEISEVLDSLWQYLAVSDVPDIHKQLLGGFHPSQSTLQGYTSPDRH